jgi:hypothetical protein
MATKSKATTQKSVKAPTIKVLGQPEKAFRTDSARDLYWQRIQQFDGKPVEAFKESVAKDVPSTPTKGKLTGKPEPVQGWISWFVAKKLISIES